MRLPRVNFHSLVMENIVLERETFNWEVSYPGVPKITYTHLIPLPKIWDICAAMRASTSTCTTPSKTALTSVAYANKNRLFKYFIGNAASATQHPFVLHSLTSTGNAKSLSPIDNAASATQLFVLHSLTSTGTARGTFHAPEKRRVQGIAGSPPTSGSGGAYRYTQLSTALGVFKANKTRSLSSLNARSLSSSRAQNTQTAFRAAKRGLTIIDALYRGPWKPKRRFAQQNTVLRSWPITFSTRSPGGLALKGIRINDNTRNDTH